MSSDYFWNQLSGPVIGLSPMDDVTDHPYRHIQKKYGNPDVIYTEFTSVEGVCHGAQRLLKDFMFDESQRPVVAQIYGTTPEYFRQTAIVLCELGFDGIDINMGCPAKNVAHSGAGAGLIRTPELAQKIIQATKDGVTDWVHGQSTRDCSSLIPEIIATVEKRHIALPAKYQTRRLIPISVKTRIGYDKEEVTDWIPKILEMDVVALALHGRTLKQRYMGEASWEAIGKAAELCHSTPTLLLGNGDITSLADAHEKIKTYALDGALIGRASWGNPFVFSSEKRVDSPTLFEIAVEHAQLYEDSFSAEERYIFLPMRKHLGWYTKGIANASEVRAALFTTNTAAEVREIFDRYHLLSPAP